jgi:hypothetical protein
MLVMRINTFLYIHFSLTNVICDSAKFYCLRMHAIYIYIYICLYGNVLRSFSLRPFPVMWRVFCCSIARSHIRILMCSFFLDWWNSAVTHAYFCCQLDRWSQIDHGTKINSSSLRYRTNGRWINLHFNTTVYLHIILHNVFFFFALSSHFLFSRHIMLISIYLFVLAHNDKNNNNNNIVHFRFAHFFSSVIIV